MYNDLYSHFEKDTMKHIACTSSCYLFLTKCLKRKVFKDVTFQMVLGALSQKSADSLEKQSGININDHFQGLWWAIVKYLKW